jgi:hypothetical protein
MAATSSGSLRMAASIAASGSRMERTMETSDERSAGRPPITVVWFGRRTTSPCSASRDSASRTGVWLICNWSASSPRTTRWPGASSPVLIARSSAS